MGYAWRICICLQYRLTFDIRTCRALQVRLDGMGAVLDLLLAHDCQLPSVASR
eukprot:SAG11_NODE_459_length_9261_cov_7.747463_4_plen_53_part_00